jgi:hypothetical protein
MIMDVAVSPGLSHGGNANLFMPRKKHLRVITLDFDMSIIMRYAGIMGKFESHGHFLSFSPRPQTPGNLALDRLSNSKTFQTPARLALALSSGTCLREYKRQDRTGIYDVSGDGAGLIGIAEMRLLCNRFLDCLN